jgi:hypothetical protein
MDQIPLASSPDISQAEKFLAVLAGQIAAEFSAGRSDQRESQQGALTFEDWRVNFRDKFIAGRFSSVVIPWKLPVIGFQWER